MSDESDLLRERARECRALSEGARNVIDREHLSRIAGDLDAEADKIDAEDEAKNSTHH